MKERKFCFFPKIIYEAQPKSNITKFYYVKDITAHEQNVDNIN